jgi:hypothetical protein
VIQEEDQLDSLVEALERAISINEALRDKIAILESTAI